MGRKDALKGPGGETRTKVLVGMPQALRDALQRMADRDDRTLTDFCRGILRRYVESQKGGKR